MTSEECLAYLTEIIRKAPTPEIAAEAIMSGGFCDTTDLDALLRKIWDEIGPNNWRVSQSKMRKAITVKWTPTEVYVRCWRFDAAGRFLPEVLKSVLDKAKAWFETHDEEHRHHKGWDQ